MDDLDADRYDMTCAAVVEKIVDLYAEGDTNYAISSQLLKYRQ